MNMNLCYIILFTSHVEVPPSKLHATNIKLKVTNIANDTNSNFIVCVCSWTLIAGRIPGRTGHEIKNYWNTHMCKRHVLEKGIVNGETLCFDTMKETVSRKLALEIKSPSVVKPTPSIVKPTTIRPHEESVTVHHSDQLIKDLLLTANSVDLDTSNISLDFLPPLPPPEFSTNFCIEDCEIKRTVSFTLISPAYILISLPSLFLYLFTTEDFPAGVFLYLFTMETFLQA
jgi:hypothetical protein